MSLAIERLKEILAELSKKETLPEMIQCLKDSSSDIPLPGTGVEIAVLKGGDSVCLVLISDGLAVCPCEKDPTTNETNDVDSVIFFLKMNGITAKNFLKIIAPLFQ